MTVAESPYAFAAVLLVASLAFAAGPLLAARAWARFFAPAKAGATKHDSYECGLPSTGATDVQFRSQYYLFGIVFLVFDVEALFLIPFAVKFLELPLGAIVAMLVFILLLVEGLVWAWMKGALEWQ